MHPWLLSGIGGVLIGLSAVVLMASIGRIAGISGIASGALPGIVRHDDLGWRLAFIGGLIAAPLLLLIIRGNSGIGAPQVSWPWMLLAGLLIGFGTRLGNGCTGGHGVCGIARLSPRSLMATGVFMVFGISTGFVIRHLLQGSLL